MAKLFSPKLAVAQESLIQALRLKEEARSDPDGFLTKNVDAAEDRLRLLGVEQTLIDEIKKSRGIKRKVKDHVTIYARKKGVVIKRHVTKGMYVKTGDRIYTIADLSRLWVHLDAYETDLAWLRYGQDVQVSTEAYPDEFFDGQVTFISPILDEQTRTVKVRVNVRLPKDDIEKLKPGMFVRARVRSRLHYGGRVVDPSFADKWISPMHPEIVKDNPGTCDKCGMQLVRAADLGYITDPRGTRATLVIPESAALITGKRAIVYVKHRVEKYEKTKKQEFVFRGREVLLGPKANDVFTVRYGLQEGEEVVVAGAFKIDADLQIQGQMSMMNPTGGAPAGGHHHHGGGEHKDHASGQAKPSKSVPLEVPIAFRPELTPVYSAYLSVTTAYQTDRRKAIQESLQRLIETAASVDLKMLEGKTRDRFRDVMDRIVFSAEKAREANTDSASLHHYSTLSAGAIDLAREFGHALKGSLHVFHAIPPTMGGGQHLWMQVTAKPNSPYRGDGMAMGKPIVPDGPVKVTPAFLAMLQPVYRSYFELQTAMSRKGHPKADQAAKALRTYLTEINPETLDAYGQRKWAVQKARLEKVPLQSWSKQPVERQREQFKYLSAVMFELVDYYGHSEAKSYYKAFCPMAFKDKGAFWLQPQKDIVNPYFSGGMRACGDTKREFQPVLLALPKKKGDRR